MWMIKNLYSNEIFADKLQFTGRGRNSAERISLRIPPRVMEITGDAVCTTGYIHRKGICAYEGSRYRPLHRNRLQP